MKKIAILNGLLFKNDEFTKGSILIHSDRIYDVILTDIDLESLKDYQKIDASGCYVCYGFLDPHVHFRSPGQEHKEDWQSGSKAAIKGGYTFVIDMPNNTPAAINAEIIINKNNLAEKTKINYGFYIGLTDNNCYEIGKIINRLKKDNVPVYGIKVFLGSSTGDMLVRELNTLNRSLNTGTINLFHCEDEQTLINYNDIEYKSIKDHHLKRPALAEVNGIMRIIDAAKKIKSKSKIYVCHVSSKEELEIIKKFKEQGFNIISEITPHHLYFHLDNIYDSNIFKVNPPIRPKSDVEYLQTNFNNGFFDIIGTDHAPHLFAEKNSNSPPSGFPGLETCFYALYDLYEKKIISLEMIFKLLTSGYRIFDIKNRGEIQKNNFADITIIIKESFKFDVKKAETKSDFSPFDGLNSNCRIHTVLINGDIVMSNGKLKI